MKKYRVLFALILPAASFFIAGFCLRAARSPSSPGFAVVELFTSEGCSSCPAADDVLAKLASEYKSDVYVLGFHVDYWNKLGWKDPYSRADYTQRQQEYARVFRLSSIYTPQAVVNGEKEGVGSDEKAIRADIEEELKKAGGKKIGLHAGSEGNKIKVDYQLTDPGTAILHIALVQSHAETRVGAGENSGRRLQHVNVVRDMKTGAGNAGSIAFLLPSGLQAKDCKVIAFLQETKNGSLAFSGAAGVDVDGPSTTLSHK